MKAENVGVVERYVLENKTGLLFVRKFKINYVNIRTCQIIVMRSFCALFSKKFTSGYVWNIRIK